MYVLLQMCCICLANTNKLKEIDILDIDNIKIERKLEYCTTKYKNIRPAIPSYICSKCCRKLRIAYEFKKSYYRSCRILKGYVSQLKRNNSCYKNAGTHLQKELQVKIMNLGECMIDGTFTQDLVQIENVETQFAGIVPESITPEIVTDITNIDNTVIDRQVTGSIEENINLVNHNNEHLDIAEDVKIFSEDKSDDGITETVDNDGDMNIKEEKEDVCKIWVENKNGNTFINFASSVVQQSVEIIQDVDVLDNKEPNTVTKDSDIENVHLNLILEGMTKSEDTGDVCKIWVENNILQENITDTVSSITVNASADIKEEVTVADSVEKENTQNANVKRKYQSCRKKMKYSNMLTEYSSDNIETNNNNIPKCVNCHKSFTYNIDLLNYLLTHSYNKPFCSLLCREQYNDK